MTTHIHEINVEEAWKSFKERVAASLAEMHKELPFKEGKGAISRRANMLQFADQCLDRARAKLGDKQVLLLCSGDPNAQDAFRKAFAEAAKKNIDDWTGSFDQVSMGFPLKRGIEKARAYSEQVFAAPRAIKDAVTNEDWARAEEIIRGQLATKPENPQMITMLFLLGCNSGDVSLVLEARRLLDPFIKTGQAHMVIGDINLFIKLFEKRIVTGFIITVDPRVFAGLILPNGTLSPSQLEHQAEIKRTILFKSCVDAQRQLAEKAEWTEEEFVNSCKGIVIHHCLWLDRTVPGINVLLPNLVGEEFSQEMIDAFHKIGLRNSHI